MKGGYKREYGGQDLRTILNKVSRQDGNTANNEVHVTWLEQESFLWWFFVSGIQKFLTQHFALISRPRSKTDNAGCSAFRPASTKVQANSLKSFGSVEDSARARKGNSVASFPPTFRKGIGWLDKGYTGLCSGDNLG